jgi:redox-sensitive bicupin YhaK (pirin superfamily)
LYLVSNEKTITARARVQRRSRSAGLSIAQLHGEHLPAHLDPFLAFDHFEMAQPFFPPHPHAGFSAVTYMFPRSENGFVNRDSRGETIDIHPGDLHWTAAGSGILHEEVPIKRGITCHGLQIFVNLRAAQKWMRPEVLHLDGGDVPLVTEHGTTARVVVGSHGAVQSPLRPPTPVTLLDVDLDAGGTFTHAVPPGESRFVYVIEGAVDAGVEVIAKGEAAGVSASGDRIVLRGRPGGAHVVVAGGVPIAEPLVFHGPFCMSTREDVVRVIEAYESGKMGRLEPSF